MRRSGYSFCAARKSRARGWHRAEFTVLRKPFARAEWSRAMAKALAEARSPDNGNVVRLQDARRDGAAKRPD
jgi:hypothetical protein